MSRLARRRPRGNQVLEFLQDIVQTRDQLCPVPDQGQAPRRRWHIHPPRDRKHKTPLCQGLRRGNQRAASRARLDNNHAHAESAHDAVPHRESGLVRLSSEGELAEHRAGRRNTVRQSLVGRRVHTVQSAPQHGQCPPGSLERRLVRFRVHPPGQPAHDRHAGLGQPVGKPAGLLPAVVCGPSRSHHGDGVTISALEVPLNVQGQWRIVDLGQRTRILRIAGSHDPRPESRRPILFTPPVHVVSLGDHGGGKLPPDSRRLCQRGRVSLENGPHRSQASLQGPNPHGSNPLHHVERDIGFPIVHACLPRTKKSKRYVAHPEPGSKPLLDVPHFLECGRRKPLRL